MNPPQVYMCSPSWILLPPPSPYHPSGPSQCTSPKHPVHRTWTGNSFHIWYFTSFNAILPNPPTLSLSHRVHKTVQWLLNCCFKRRAWFPIPIIEEPRYFLTVQWGYFDVPKTRSPVQLVTAPLDVFVCLPVWAETSGWRRNSQLPYSWLQTGSEWYGSGEETDTIVLAAYFNSKGR